MTFDEQELFVDTGVTHNVTISDLFASPRYIWSSVGLIALFMLTILL